MCFHYLGIINKERFSLVCFYDACLKSMIAHSAVPPKDVAEVFRQQVMWGCSVCCSSGYSGQLVTDSKSAGTQSLHYLGLSETQTALITGACCQLCCVSRKNSFDV